MIELPRCARPFPYGRTSVGGVARLKIGSQRFWSGFVGYARQCGIDLLREPVGESAGLGQSSASDRPTDLGSLLEFQRLSPSIDLRGQRARFAINSNGAVLVALTSALVAVMRQQPRVTVTSP
jgi:hypothetical protein